MVNENDDDRLRDAWLARLHAVSKAQGRYLYVLMLLALFFWALLDQVVEASDTEITLPFLFVPVSSRVILAAGPSVLSLMVLAILGSLQAVRRAREEYERLAPGVGHVFEALDTAPNAIDLVVYGRARPWVTELGLVSYPLLLSLAIVESMLILRWLWCSSVAGKIIFLPLGVLCTLAALPRLISLWRSKVAEMAHSRR